MKVDHAPVTGEEIKDHLSAPMQALSDFYEALNSRDMKKMARKWAQTDESVMDNPPGGIKRGGKKSELSMSRFLIVSPNTILSSMSTAFTTPGTFSTL